MALEYDLSEMVEGKRDFEGFNRGRKLVIERCQKAEIKIEEVDEDEFAVEMPAGRGTTRLRLTEKSDTDALLSIEFEKYGMLGDFLGIYSYGEGIIEAAVRPVSIGMTSAYFLLRRLFGTDVRSDTGIEPIVLRQRNTDASLTVILGEPSPELQVFERLCGSSSSRISIRITNLKVGTHDRVLRTLEQLSNALFFQIDLKMGIALGLQRERPRRLSGRIGRPNGKLGDLTFPNREFESQPMSLYWYAKSARGMPLLQFLAYYQVLEFFMPTYSNHEAVMKARNIMKDPRFTPDKDSQIARVLAVLRPSSRGFGDERSQLESVLRSCVSPEELRKFYLADKNRVAFYKDGFKSVAPQKIPLDNKVSDLNKASDLLTETAQRLYEIRCRIVHTKDHADRDLQALLPYSKEAGNLYEDIALSEFVAVAVLIASSTMMPES